MNTYGVWKGKRTFGVQPLAVYEAEDREAARAMFEAEDPAVYRQLLIEGGITITQIFVNKEAL